MRGSRDRLIRATLMGACALAFVLLAGAEHASADTRLIAHFEDDSDADVYGRDVLRDFYHSQGAAEEDNLFPDTMGVNLAPFSLTNAFFSAGVGASFELHQFGDDGDPNPPAGLIGECRFAAFGSGWSLGVADAVEDFQINFITVANEDDDDDYVPVNPWSAEPALTNNSVDGSVQDWSAYEYLCFYICINASDIPDQQFFDDFTIQLWEYWVDVTPAVGGNPPVVNHNEREIFEVSLGDYVGDEPRPIRPFTGWKHIRIPLADFDADRLDLAESWRYTDTASVPAFAAMSDSLDTDHIRAVIFRKDNVDPANVDVTYPGTRVTVAIDEIVVTGSTNARVARRNIPGATDRCDDNEPRGLCWAQLFDDDPAQEAPYASAVRPPGEGEADKCVDVTVWVRDWEDLNATFSAEVDNGAEVAETDVSSEIVFAPQFQAPGTWVERWRSGGDFFRRKGTIDLGGPVTDPRYLFYTDWRYDYDNGDPVEDYLVSYDVGPPVPATAIERLDPDYDPRGGFLANYFREYGYAYGTLFVLPRDGDGNIGQAEVIDVLFRSAPVRTLHHDRLTTGLP